MFDAGETPALLPDAGEDACATYSRGFAEFLLRSSAAAAIYLEMLSVQDQERFTRLWTEAQPAVAGYVHATVRDAAAAKDIVQETALVLLRRFGEYDAARPFLPWALGVARFQILGFRRDEVRSPVTFDSELFDRFTSLWAELAPRISDEGAALQTCLEKLAHRSREVVHLRYFEALSSDDIARRLGSNPGSIRVLLQRTREQLRKCVERQLGASAGAA